MNSLKYLGSLLFVAASAVALTGCEFDAGIDVDPGVVVVDDLGSLSFEIAVDGREDRLVCDDFGVAAARVRIFDSFGDLADVEEFDCEDFGGTVYDLSEDDYTAEISLLGFGGETISTTIQLRGLDVIDDTDLDSSVDFPAASID